MTIAPTRPDEEAVPESPPDDKEPWFSRLARFSGRHRRAVMVVWLVAMLGAAPLALTLTNALSGAGWEAQGSTSVKVRDELRADFGELGAEAAVVVYRQSTPIAEDPTGVEDLVAELRTQPAAAGVVDPLSQPAEAGLLSRDGLVAMVPVQLSAETDAELPESAGELIDAVEGMALPEGARAEVTGEWPVWSDFNDTNEEALHRAELVSGIPTMILLFIAFGSAIAAGIPLVLALAGIAVGFAALHLLGDATPLSVWSMNFSMMIGLAVGIDYSLFIVSRYREEREDGYDALDAIANTLSTAGKAVFLSALAVVMSLAAVFVVPVMVFRSMALGMILSVVAVGLAALTLLPAVLVAMGDRVLVARGHSDPDRVAEGRWTRWTGAALNHPGRTLVAGLALLVLLAAPAIGMRLGMPGAGVVDEGRSSRDGYDMVVDSFGPGAAAPLFVTTPAQSAGEVVELATADPERRGCPRGGTTG
ncbi:MAG: MMPL family transporter [Microthrixaceae bacterium]|nr:MMPL family transporter [Microthrixaceae bacterium]